MLLDISHCTGQAPSPPAHQRIIQNINSTQPENAEIEDRRTLSEVGRGWDPCSGNVQIRSSPTVGGKCSGVSRGGERFQPNCIQILSNKIFDFMDLPFSTSTGQPAFKHILQWHSGM